MDELKQKADSGDPNALVYLGIMFREGVGGVAKSPRRATELFYDAAVQGNADAQCALGDIYTRIEPRLALAYFWLTLCTQT